MTDNQMDENSVFENKMKRRSKFPPLNLKLSGGLNILVIVAILVVVSYNLCFVYVQPDEYGIKVIRIGIIRGVQKRCLSCRPDICSALRAAAGCIVCQRVFRCWS